MLQITKTAFQADIYNGGISSQQHLLGLQYPLMLYVINKGDPHCFAEDPADIRFI